MSTVSQIVDTLRESIKEGRIVPGQRLVENDLTREYGVSRGPLREAFAHLAAEGLLEMTPYRGAVVRKLGREELADLYGMREILEAQAARLAARHIDRPGHRERFTAGWDALVAAAAEAAEDPAVYVDENERFHNLIVELSGNKLLIKHVGMLRLQIFPLQFRRTMRPSARARSMADHGEIARAVLAGDEEAAHLRMQEHVQQAAAEVASLLEG